MTECLYRYSFPIHVPFHEVRSLFDDAMRATISLHGETAVRMDARYAYDTIGRTFIVNAGTEIGQSLNRLFAGLLREHLGESGFTVERIDRSTSRQQRSVRAAEGVMP